jgi:hypothetical protein
MTIFETGNNTQLLKEYQAFLLELHPLYTYPELFIQQ